MSSQALPPPPPPQNITVAEGTCWLHSAQLLSHPHHLGHLSTSQGSKQTPLNGSVHITNYAASTQEEVAGHRLALAGNTARIFL